MPGWRADPGSVVFVPADWRGDSEEETRRVVRRAEQRLKETLDAAIRFFSDPKNDPRKWSRSE